MKTQRIDGQDYVVGSAEHSAAIRTRRRRLDAVYLKKHEPLLQRHVSMLRRWDGLSSKIRNDANLVAFLGRELVYVRATVERTIYDQLRAGEFVPIETGHPRGAKSYSTELWDQRGEAKITHDLAGDAPRADVSKSEDLRKYVNVRGAYGYTVQ